MSEHLEGMEELLNTLDQLGSGVLLAEIAPAMYDFGKIVEGDARANCPHDVGTMEQTIEAHEAEVSNTDVTVPITAGGPEAPATLAAHEHISQHSPPSWKSAEASGRGVHFQGSPKRGPKFLTRAIMGRKDQMLSYLAERISLRRAVQAAGGPG
jgi:hypothetical protein